MPLKIHHFWLPRWPSVNVTKVLEKIVFYGDKLRVVSRALSKSAESANCNSLDYDSDW